MSSSSRRLTKGWYADPRDANGRTRASHDRPDRVPATVLFTDLAGSTARASELGDRGWRDLLEQHHAAARRELERFGGRDVDTAGDGFFATFEGPSLTDHTARAGSTTYRSVQAGSRQPDRAGDDARWFAH